MRIILALALFALVLTNNVGAKRTGGENWKQRYAQWKAEDERFDIPVGGELIGTDEAAAARLHREGNVVSDTDSEHGDDDIKRKSNEEWRRKIELKKQQQEEWQRKIELKKQRQEQKGKPVSEITAWHEKKHQREYERRLQEPYNEKTRPKRRQPREFRLERHQMYHADSVSRVSNPPPHTKVAEMARYIVHNSDWAAVAYTSHQPETNGLPMADIFSISDGIAGNSTGIPYMYLTPKDMGVQDLAKDSRCSLAMSLAQGDYCRKESLDPEDPRCAHVFLSGKIKALKNGTDEWARAEKFFFDRHPGLRNMPPDHHFRFAKLKISSVLVQDYFGGPAHPTLAEYFAAKPEDPNVASVPAREEQAELLPGSSSTDMKSIPFP